MEGFNTLQTEASFVSAIPKEEDLYTSFVFGKYASSKEDEETGTPKYFVDEGNYGFQIRSALVGGLTGSILAASNIYFGLQIGWTFGSSLFTAILGYGFMKSIPQCRNGFGTHENNLIQTAGSAAGSLGAGLVSAIPALMMFGYKFSMLTLLVWVACSAFYGVFYAVPIRKKMLLEQKLVFPTGTATGIVIRSLHTKPIDPAIKDERPCYERPMFQAKLLIIVMTATLTYKTATFFFPDLQRFQFGCIVGIPQLAGWHWYFSDDLAFLSIGTLSGTRVSISYFTGAIIGHAIIAPLIWHHQLVSVFSGYGNGNSIKFWLLWVGVGCLVGEQLTACVIIMLDVIKSFFARRKQRKEQLQLSQASLACPDAVSIRDKEDAVYNDSSNDSLNASSDEDDDHIERPNIPLGFPSRRLDLLKYPRDSIGIPYHQVTGDYLDTAPPNSQIPLLWIVVGGLTVSTATVLTVTFLFGVTWYCSIIAIIIAFFFAMMGTQSTGQCDINPTGGLAKITQFIFAGINPGNIITNLMSGNIAGAGASQCADMMQDLKAGLILGASPRDQFIAQIVGSLFGIIVTTGVYQLFNSVYEIPGPEFPAPAANAWYGVGLILSERSSALPPYAGVTALTFMGIAVATNVAKRLSPLKFRQWYPSFTCIGLGIMTDAKLGLMIICGNIAGHVIKYLAPKYYEGLMYSFTAGVVAGDGLGGIIRALLTMAGLKTYVLPSMWEQCAAIGQG